MTDTIDQGALRSKYREERDKRLRVDGNEQYIELTGRFAEYLEDPYVEPEPREPLTDEVTVAFIGGGFAGLVTGAKLKQAGVDDVRIIEKGGDFGGTWYWNRYPGAQCDTAAFIYMPLLEETGHTRRGRGGLGRTARGGSTHVRRQPRLHPRLLQQRGT